MAKILQIETSTTICSVALAVDGSTIALKEANERNVHAGSLTLFIDDVMRQAALTYAELDAIAVCMGPGSYTGLRIGVSTAKGICFATDKPLIAVSTLKMMAYGFHQQQPEFEGYICPMIDARRMEVYTALFNNNLDEIAPVEAKIIDKTSFHQVLTDNKVAFIGDGAEKCAAEITLNNAVFVAGNFNSAGNMSLLAADKFKNNDFEDVAYFEPFYLKDFMLTQPKKLI